MAASTERDKSQWHELPEYRQYSPVIKGYERFGRKFVDVLGVELERAQVDNGPLVPKLEGFKDIQLDNDFQVILQQIAIAFKLGLPILVESGTSLGKTTAVRFICALCGYEFHKVVLKGSSDTEDFMGKFVNNTGVQAEYYDFTAKAFIPNDGKARYIYSPGKVTAGLIPEAGKVKVILLDEYNAAKPNIAIRMHEVLDALKNNSSITLTEAENQDLEVNSDVTKLVALQNPTGEGYQKRELLDPAQIRRWIYQRDAEKLSEVAQDQVISTTLGSKLPNKRSPGVLAIEETQENPLVADQVETLPGWELMKRLIKAFHKDMLDKLSKGVICKDQRQKFSFDDREEPARVMRFIFNFYAGDLTKVVQDALRYTYRNKLQSATDRQIVEEAIKLVEYRPPTGESKRVALYGKPGVKAKTPVAKKSLNPEEKASPLVSKSALAPPSPKVMPHTTGRTMAEVEAEEKAGAEKLELEALLESWVSEMASDAGVVEDWKKLLEKNGFKEVTRAEASAVVAEAKKELARILAEGPEGAKWKSKLSNSQREQVKVAKEREQKAIIDLENQISGMKDFDANNLFNF